MANKVNWKANSFNKIIPLTFFFHIWFVYAIFTCQSWRSAGNYPSYILVIKTIIIWSGRRSFPCLASTIPRGSSDRGWPVVLKLQVVQTISSCLRVATGPLDWEAARSLCKAHRRWALQEEQNPLPSTYILPAHPCWTYHKCASWEYVAWHPAEVGNHPGWVTLGWNSCKD